MSRATLQMILGYGLLAGLLLACVWLISVASIRLSWTRELAGGLIALLAVVVGMRLVSRPVAADVRPSPALEPPPAPPAPAPPDDPGLSPRERQVLGLLAEGQSNKQIARSLSLSENTIKTHLANVYAKLGAAGRTEALALARRRRLLVDG